MSPAVHRVYQRLSRKKDSSDAYFLRQRKRALTIPLPEEAQRQQTADQSQSAFFANLPLEIRLIIYQEVLSGQEDVVHVIKKPKKLLGLIRCKGKCAMAFNYKCRAGELLHDYYSPLSTSVGPDQGLWFLLQTCRRAYTEAIDILYGHYLFDFRSFYALISLSETILPQRWNTIRKMHLQWHFGYGLWSLQNPAECRRYDPAWVKVWNILSQMEGLGELHVDLDAYLAAKSLSPEVEAEVLEPLMRLTVAHTFVVKISWQSHLESSNVSLPFRLDQPTDRGGIPVVSRTLCQLQIRECVRALNRKEGQFIHG